MRTRRLTILPAAAALLIIVSLHNHYFCPVYAKQDMRSAVELVNERAGFGDVIIVSSVEIGGPFIYYFDRRSVPYYGYPSGELVDPGSLPRDIYRMIEHRKRAPAPHGLSRPVSAPHRGRSGRRSC